MNQLLKELRDNDKKKRKNAIDRLGEVGNTEEVLRALKNAENTDDDRKNRSSAKDAANKVQERMRSKTKIPEQLEITQPVEVQQESEDALTLQLTETQKGTINRDGTIYESKGKEEDTEERPSFTANGSFSVKNSGEIDRIWDIDIEVKDTGITDLKKTYHINELNPQEEWKQEYEIKELSSALPLTFSEIIDTFPDNTSKTQPSNVLVYGQSMKTNIKYTLGVAKKLTDIVFTKNIPAHFKDITVQSASIGKASIERDKLVWKIASIEQNQNAELTITTSITVEDIEVKRTGTATLAFHSGLEGAFSNVDIYGADGLVKNNSYVEADEVEDRPDNWQCNLVFEIKSEYDVELREIKIAKDEEVYISHEFTENEIIVKSGQKWESEEWNVVSEELPSFQKYVEFTVKPEILYVAQSDLLIVDTTMRVANVKSSKSYAITQVDSFREMQVPTAIEVQNIGSLAFSTLTIKDQVPAKFLPPSPDTIKVSVGDTPEKLELIRDYEITYDPSTPESSDTEHMMYCKINQQIEPNYTVKLEYTPTVVKAKPNETFTGVAEITAELAEPGPNLVRQVEDWLTANTITVLHERKAITVGKQVLPGAEPKIYEIELLYINRGDKTLENVRIRDVIPEGFTIVDDSMQMVVEGKKDQSIPEGKLRTWLFEKIEPKQQIVIKYRMHGESDDFKAGQAQLSRI